MSNNLKNILAGLFAVLVVCLFAFSVINITKESSSKQMTALNDIKISAEKESVKANKKIDSMLQHNSQLSKEIDGLENHMDLFDRNIWGLSKKFEKSINEIKDLKNEKNYIPDHAPFDEQSDFLSKYRYKEY